ncbi:MAG: hypothetical protein IJC17_05455 [Clostridia bacterium]|nr:hypothetical protein [Clostridia bacterium]
MFEPIQIITFQRNMQGTCSPEAPQYAGVQGDNGRTCVDFVVPSEYRLENAVYRVEVVTGGGSLVTSELLTPANDIVSLVLTRPFTEAGGRCTIRLIVTSLDENGDEQAEMCAMVGRLYFEDRPSEGVPAIKHGISEMLAGVAADISLAEKSAATAKQDAESALYNRMEALLSATDAANSAAEAAKTAEEMAKSMADLPSLYAPASVATATGNPAVLSHCADRPIVDLQVSGNSTQSAVPSRENPVPIQTAFVSAGTLRLFDGSEYHSINLGALNLDKWDTLFRDDDRRWKIRRGTQTISYNGSTTVTETSQKNEDYVRYQLGNQVFDPIRQRGDGVCTHLPRITNATSGEGVLFGFNTGSHIHVVLKTDDFPDKASVSAWLDEQDKAGTPITLKFPSDNPVVEEIPDELQAQLQALHTRVGENVVDVLNENPASVVFKAVADAPIRSDGPLEVSAVHLLSPTETVTAHSAGGNLKLYAANDTALIPNMVYCHCVCAEKSKTGFNAIIHYSTLSGVSAYAVLYLTEGAYLKTADADTILISER